MQQKEALINILDKTGKIVGQKKRSEVDKKKDILQSVNIILLNKENQLFLVKAVDQLYNNFWGSSAAGLVRHGESVEQAAKRTLERELNVQVSLVNLGEQFVEFDGIKRFMSLFYCKTNHEPILNNDDASDGNWFSFEDTKKLIETKHCIPTFKFAFAVLEDGFKKNHLNH
ncbi:hypothetical protein COV18_07430 [Candidatus Woesearchaeota archaeon CG10_big_fil_rev_8_21_14_0_10_37_12]|nr:MAG: hypothetical protein COV18_07430 [Candidatus Woesearchaeota archaeon CG10_big_fil_rev_8_21_14_0_10_37_12]